MTAAQALHDDHAAAGKAPTAQALAVVVRGKFAGLVRELGSETPARQARSQIGSDASRSGG